MLHCRCASSFKTKLVELTEVLTDVKCVLHAGLIVLTEQRLDQDKLDSVMRQHDNN